MTTHRHNAEQFSSRGGRGWMRMGKSQAVKPETSGGETVKTKRVRIAVAMASDGEWASFGKTGVSDETAQSLACGSLLYSPSACSGKVTFIEAEVECGQEPETVKGEVAP